MKVRVLTTEGNIQSAGKLGFPTYTRVEDITDDLATDEVGVMVRWGHSGGNDHELVLNPAAAISDNCDKLSSKQALAGAVDAPAIYTSRVPRGITAVLRPLEHSQGSGFQLVAGPCAVPAGSYASKFIKTEKEYRVWFCGSHVFCARRVPMEGQGQAADEPCRSKWGYAWQDDVFPILGRKTQLARETLGLDLGAADVLWHEEERKYYFLELNTACSLDHRKVLEFFKRSIPLAIQRKYSTIGVS